MRLRNVEHGFEVEVHTALDGTPVFTRWLDIRNAGDTPVALTTVIPWCGGLWPVVDEIAASEWKEDVYTIGYPPMEPGRVRQNQQREGLSRCEWRSLPVRLTTIDSNSGVSYDDPFFIVRNKIEGAYFIGRLAWTANCGLSSTSKRTPGGDVRVSPSRSARPRRTRPSSSIPGRAARHPRCISARSKATSTPPLGDARPHQAVGHTAPTQP